MKKYIVFQFQTGMPVDMKELEARLNNGWSIERADMCNGYIVYILSITQNEK